MPVSKRLFLAINLDGSARDAVASVQQQVRKQLSKSDVTWTHKANLHITLHFLGNVEEERETRLREALRNLKLPQPEKVAVASITFQVTSVELMQSTLAADGSIYTVIESFRL